MSNLDIFDKFNNISMKIIDCKIWYAIILKPNNRYYRYIHHCGEILGDTYTFTSEFPKIEKQKIRVQQEFKKKPVTKCKKWDREHITDILMCDEP